MVYTPLSIYLIYIDENVSENAISSSSDEEEEVNDENEEDMDNKGGTISKFVTLVAMCMYKVHIYLMCILYVWMYHYVLCYNSHYLVTLCNFCCVHNIDHM